MDLVLFASSIIALILGIISISGLIYGLGIKTGKLQVEISKLRESYAELKSEQEKSFLITERLDRALERIGVKVDTLWTALTENMLLDGLRYKLSQEGSYELTEKGKQILGDELISQIKSMRQNYKAPRSDFQCELYQLFSARLAEAAKKSGLSLNAVFGAALVIAYEEGR